MKGECRDHFSFLPFSDMPHMGSLRGVVRWAYSVLMLGACLVADGLDDIMISMASGRLSAS